MPEESPIFYAYSDESPTLSSRRRHLVVGVVVTFAAGYRHLVRIPKRARGKLKDKRLRRTPELKFNNSDKRTREHMLRLLAGEEVEIFVLVVDKGGRRVSDSPENNGVVLGNAAALVLKRRKRVSLTLDKKFVRPTDTSKYLNTAINVVLRKVPTGILTVSPPVDSRKESLVQLADFVAGAISQKYNWGNDTYYRILEKKIVEEKQVRWRRLKAEYVSFQKNKG